MSFRIVATDQLVDTKQFAALDACDKACWVDDAFHAVTFETMHEAEQFGDTWLGQDGWKVEAFA